LVHVRNKASTGVKVENRVSDDSWNEVSFEVRRDGELVEQNFVVGQPGLVHFYSGGGDALHEGLWTIKQAKPAELSISLAL
jgi:hypothetical protein